MKKGEELKTRNCKLLNAFKYALLDESLRFLDSALLLLIQLNLRLQQADPLIDILYDSLFRALASFKQICATRFGLAIQER